MDTNRIDLLLNASKEKISTIPGLTQTKLSTLATEDTIVNPFDSASIGLPPPKQIPTNKTIINGIDRTPMAGLAPIDRSPMDLSPKAIEEGAKRYDLQQSNLLDTAQYGVGRALANAGDFVVDAGTGVGKELYKASNTLKGKYETPEQVNKRFASSIKGTWLENHFDKTGDFKSLDKYKQAVEYGYDDVNTREAMKSLGDAWQSKDPVKMGESLISATVNAGPEFLLESAGELGLGLLGKAGLALNAGSYTNQILEDRKKITGKEATPQETALVAMAGTAEAYLNKLGVDEMVGRTNLVKGAIKTITEYGSENSAKNALKTIAKKAAISGATVVGKAGYEGLEEVLQEGLEIIGEKYGTKAQEDILNDKSYQRLFQAFGGGFAGGAVAGSISESSNVLQDITKVPDSTRTIPERDTEDVLTETTSAIVKAPQKQPTPDEMLRTLDEVEAELKTTGEYELGKAELEQNRREWTDIKNAVDNEDVYKELKDIFNTTEDVEQKNYLGKILKKADSYLGKAKTLFDAVEGTPNEGVYTAADNIVRGMGSEWDAKLSKPLDIADAIQSVQTLREIRNEYGVNVKNTDKEDALYNKAVNAVKTVLTQQLGKYPNFEQLSSEQRVGIIGDELYNWLKQSASDEDINGYMASMIHPVVEAMAESKAFGSAPKGSGLTLDMSKFEKPSGKEQPAGGLKLNLEGMSKPQAEAKTDWKEQQSKTKEKVKAKLFADESMDVEDITTDTHTGISKGTINKLAEIFKVPAGKVKSALDIAFQRMQIKKMGDISKESNEAQYNVYYGEDGVLPNFIKYKYAAEKGDIDTATKAMDNLVKRYSDQMYKLMIAMDSINPVQSKIRTLGKDVTLEELQKEIGDVRITIQGAKGSKSEYTIDGMSIAKMTDSVPQNVRDQIKMGKGGHVLEAIHESVVHLQNMFDREGLADALPEVRFNKVLREDIYNNLVDKIAGLMDKRDKLAKVDLDPSVKRTSEELDAMANATKELADVEKELTKRIKEQQEVFQARSGNLYQYNNTTFRDQDKGIDVSKKMGQETGTITKVEADRLGLDLEEGVIKDYVPMKSADEYKKILDKINALREERAAETANRNELTSDVIEQHKNRKLLLDKIKVVEEQLGYKVLTTARKAAENADKLVTDLTVRLMKEKAREKELKSALAFLEKNEDVFKNATVNAEQLVKLQDSYGKWMNDVVSKKGKMPTAKERNDKLREMVQGTTLLETIVNDLNKVAKIGVVLARKLMGMYTYDKPLMEVMKTELANVASKVEKTQEELAKAKVDMKEQVRQSRIQIVQAFRENGITPDMSAKTIENVLMKSTRLKALERKINSAKKMSETRLNEINAEIKELENELKGTRLFKQNVENNLNVVDALRKAGIEIKAPLDMNTLKTRGSMLGNMNFNDVMSMVPGDKDIENLLKVTEGQVSKGMERLYTGTVGVQKLGQLLAANPALMLIARVSKVDGKEAYELNYDKDMLNALMLTMNNYIAINGSDLDINTKLDVSKIIGVSEYDPKVNQVYHRMMGMGKLHTTIASRIGDDFVRAIGISQGDMGTEQYRKLIADLGNTALIMAKENKLVEEPRMTADQWNEVAGKSSRIPEGSGAEVKFVKLGKTNNTNVKVRASTATIFKRLNDTLNSLNEQNTYRTHKIFAVKNGKKYEIDKSPFGIPEKTQEVMRHLEDQTYVLQEKALAKMLETYRSNPELVLEKAGWVGLDSMKDSLQDDKDAQKSVNREIEDTLAKLDEMEAAYTRGEITEDVYFNWFFTVNGRFMIDSVGINPQADKHFSRFLLVPEQSSNREWDLSNEIDKLLMNDGIAQAFGYDIDKSSEEATEKFAKDIISRFRNDEKFEDKVMSGEIEVPHFGHALQAIEFMRVMKKGGKFRGTLTAEYDAKTSGPMHKLMQAPILDDGEFGSITKEWLNKGAILINQGFSESSAEHVSGVEDGYQTIAKEANRALTEQSPVLIRNDKITTDYRSLFKDINGLLDKLVSDNKVTEQGRELSKYAFIPFGYASSTETIKQYVGEQLAYDILKKIVNPKFSNHSNIMRALNMNAKDYARLQENLRTKPANEVYINKPQGVITYKKDILGMLSEMFTMTYGEAYKSAMNSIFRPHVAMNDTIKDVTSAMFRMWKIKYDSMMAKEPNATVERKMEVIRDMEDFFPLIKAPWSYSKQDGIAIFDTKRASMKNEELPPVNTTTNRDGKLSSETVQAMITEMEETFAAGAVLPIHWIDGTQIASVLMRGGITGVHDAIVIGMKGSYTQQTVKDMNKAMYDVNRNYNMFDEFQLALLNMIDKIDDSTLKTFIRQESKKEDKGIDLGSLKARVDNIAENIRKARTKLYSNEVTVGNIIAFRDTEFKSGKDESTVNPRETSIKELLKKLDARMQGIETTINEVSSKDTAEEGIENIVSEAIKEAVEKVTTKLTKKSNQQAERLKAASAANAEVGGSEYAQAELRKQVMTPSFESREKKKYGSMTKEQTAELEQMYEQNRLATQGKAKLSDDIIDITICK